MAHGDIRAQTISAMNGGNVCTSRPCPPPGAFSTWNLKTMTSMCRSHSPLHSIRQCSVSLPNNVAASDALKLNWASKNLGPNVDMPAMSVASVAPARQSRMKVGFLRRSQMELGERGTEGRKRQRVRMGQSLCARNLPFLKLSIQRALVLRRQ